MIIAESKDLLNAAFDGNLPFFQCEENDNYTHEVKLFDRDEIQSHTITTLYIMEGGYSVAVESDDTLISEEQFDDAREAWKAYERQAAMPERSLTIKDPVSGELAEVKVTDYASVEDGTYYAVSYEARTSAEVDCTFAVIEHDDGSMVCQGDWHDVTADVDDIADTRWVDCTPYEGPVYVTATEAAEILGVSRQRVNQLVNSGLLAAKKIGGMWYVLKTSVDERRR